MTNRHSCSNAFLIDTSISIRFLSILHFFGTLFLPEFFRLATPNYLDLHFDVFFYRWYFCVIVFILYFLICSVITYMLSTICCMYYCYLVYVLYVVVTYLVFVYVCCNIATCMCMCVCTPGSTFASLAFCVTRVSD